MPSIPWFWAHWVSKVKNTQQVVSLTRAMVCRKYLHLEGGWQKGHLNPTSRSTAMTNSSVCSSKECGSTPLPAWLRVSAWHVQAAWQKRHPELSQRGLPETLPQTSHPIAISHDPLSSFQRDLPCGPVVRVCLPMQGTWVWSLFQEDPSCCRAAKPVCHSYWAHVP